MNHPKVLVACEFSGIVTDAFRKIGIEAYSCDILPTEGNTDWHIQDDILKHLTDGWDLMIAHPPCTYICNGGVNWINRRPEWRTERTKALAFVQSLLNAPIPRIALENPIGAINTEIRKPDQILHAYQFGHPYKKDICFWLKNLPKLQPTKLAPPPYKTFDFWSRDRFTATGGNKKSITFQGVADAMVAQWGALL